MCSLGIEPTTFCAADAILYHWATQEYVIINIYEWRGAKLQPDLNKINAIWLLSIYYLINIVYIYKYICLISEWLFKFDYIIV